MWTVDLPIPKIRKKYHRSKSKIDIRLNNFAPNEGNYYTNIVTERIDLF